MEGAGGAFLQRWWRDVFGVVDAVVEDGSGAFYGVDEEFYGWEGWFEEVAGGFEECCLWGRGEAFGVLVLRVTCCGFSFLRGSIL